MPYLCLPGCGCSNSNKALSKWKGELKCVMASALLNPSARGFQSDTLEEHSVPSCRQCHSLVHLNVVHWAEVVIPFLVAATRKAGSTPPSTSWVTTMPWLRCMLFMTMCRMSWYHPLAHSEPSGSSSVLLHTTRKLRLAHTEKVRLVEHCWDASMPASGWSLCV